MSSTPTSAEIDPELVAPEVSTRTLMPFLQRFDADPGRAVTDRILAELGLPRAYLEDPRNWVSVGFVHRFVDAAARQIYGLDGTPVFEHEMWQDWRKIGRGAFRTEAMGPLYHVVRALGSPQTVYRATAEFAQRLNRNVRIDMLDERPGLLRLRVGAAGEGRPFHVGGYWNTLGLLEAVPTVWGLPLARVVMERLEGDLAAGTGSVVYLVEYVEPRLPEVWKLVVAGVGGAVLAAGVAAVVGVDNVSLAGMTGLCAGLSGELWRRLRRVREAWAADGERFHQTLAESDERWSALWEEQRSLRRALLASRKLSGYLAGDLVDRILDDPELELSLGGHRTDAAVLFADIVGFTPRCEPMSPEAVVEELNLYFSHVDRAFTRHGGVIDKRMGDGIMAVFVARDGEDGAGVRARSVACGLDMLRELGPCNAELGRRGAPPLQIRVGVAAGPLVQGNMGSDAKLEYTVVGDTVNLAARLESSATPGHVLAAAAMVPDGLRGLGPCRITDRRTISVKGKAERIDVVELAVEAESGA